MAELRSLKRRAGVAEEALRIKKERLNDAEQEYQEEHRTFTVFSQRLQEKWEQRFETLAQLARDAGVQQEDIEAVRKQPPQEVAAVQDRAAAEQEAAATSERAAAAERVAATEQRAVAAEQRAVAAEQRAAAAEQRAAAAEQSEVQLAAAQAATARAAEAAAARAADEAAWADRQATLQQVALKAAELAEAEKAHRYNGRLVQEFGLAPNMMGAGLVYEAIATRDWDQGEQQIDRVSEYHNGSRLLMLGDGQLKVAGLRIDFVDFAGTCQYESCGAGPGRLRPVDDDKEESRSFDCAVYMYAAKPGIFCVMQHDDERARNLTRDENIKEGRFTPIYAELGDVVLHEYSPCDEIGIYGQGWYTCDMARNSLQET